jgi:hypothetical protein
VKDPAGNLIDPAGGSATSVSGAAGTADSRRLSSTGAADLQRAVDQASAETVGFYRIATPTSPSPGRRCKPTRSACC